MTMAVLREVEAKGSSLTQTRKSLPTSKKLLSNVQSEPWNSLSKKCIKQDL